MFNFSLVAEFLRCQEAARVLRTNRENNRHPKIQGRLSFKSREAEFNQDIRDAAEARHATRRAEGLHNGTSSAYSLGFSIDSDGHWHDRADYGRDYRPFYTPDYWNVAAALNAMATYPRFLIRTNILFAIACTG